MKHGKAPSLLLGAAGVMLAASTALTVAYVLDIRRAGAASPVPSEHAGPDQAALGAEERSAGQVDEVVAAAEAFLDREVELQFDGDRIQHTWRDLGLVVEEDAAKDEAARFASLGEVPDASAYSDGMSDGEVPVTLDEELARDALLDLKGQLDRSPQGARLDLEGRKVHHAQPGFGIDPYRSASALELAARTGQPSVELEGVELPPSTTVEDLGIDDISEVMGRFSTRYGTHQERRVANLKRAAADLNGYVIQPGEEFSFNETLGERKEEIGYKVATVIRAGEFADGTAGGICQISSTLNGAAFFAGLEIVRARPHSRPIGYIPMALDATVVYPYVDVKFKNDYDFPVVIHYRVAEGEALVEILGKGRPYDEIEFVRQIREEIPFESITRDDADMPVGTMRVQQHGYLGYDIIRYRNFYKDGEIVKRDRWNLEYPPVTEYVRVGTNTDPNLMGQEPEQQESRNPAVPRTKRHAMRQ